jgi:hypothetical protein
VLIFGKGFSHTLKIEKIVISGSAVSACFLHSSARSITSEMQYNILKLYLIKGSGCFFHDKMIAPVLLMGRGLLPPRKAKHGLGSCSSESFK